MARSWISSWMWSVVISCISGNRGIASLMNHTDASVRARRGSGSMPASDARGKGSTLSQYGSVRSEVSVASSWCRCVVPVRGRPTMMIGGSRSRSTMPGSRVRRSIEQQPVLQQLEDLAVEAEHAGVGEPGHVAESGEQHVEARLVVAVAEVVEAGVGDRLPTQRVGVELAGGPHRRHRLEDLDDLGREPWLGQVVDVDVGHQVPLVPAPLVEAVALPA